METACSKVAFRLNEEDNLLPMAKWLFRGAFNPDEIKHELYSRKVVDYREEYRTLYGESNSSGQSRGTSYSHSGGDSYTSAVEGDDAERWARHSAYAHGGSDSRSDGHATLQPGFESCSGHHLRDRILIKKGSDLFQTGPPL